MKRYHLPTLIKDYPDLRNDIYLAGTLVLANTHIDLPDTFNFDGNNPLAITVPKEPWVLFKKPARELPTEKDLPDDLKNWREQTLKTEKGLGDLIERTIGTDNSQAFQTWFKDTFGFSCGCKSRKDWLNKVFPFSKT